MPHRKAVPMIININKNLVKEHYNNYNNLQIRQDINISFEHPKLVLIT